MCTTNVVSILFTLFYLADGSGVLLLYRPKDVSNECAISQDLRYDVSFGMGMSDTITLVFRTMSDIDYECGVEIVTEKASNIFLLVVIRFPNTFHDNCLQNPDAFTVFRKDHRSGNDECLRLCEHVDTRRDNRSPYFVMSVLTRIRFRFVSNSSLNSDMEVDLYEVTATSARLKGKEPCQPLSESICEMGGIEFCFTSGVVCDGIKNCGVADWFDERKSECKTHDDNLGYTPVIAVAAALLCALLAATHILLQCLPPLANSFFIFNANEDNRLCIDPFLKPLGVGSNDSDRMKKTSLIPVSSSSSSDEISEDICPSVHEQRHLNVLLGSGALRTHKILDVKKGKSTVRSVTAKIHERLKSVAGRGAMSRNNEEPMQFDA